MNIFRALSTRRGAQVDARSGLDSMEDRIVSELGPRPKIDAVGNTEHAGFVKALAESVRIDELREDLTAAEDAFAKHTPPYVLIGGLVVAVAVEVEGALLLMKALGVAPEERLPLGLGLAFALIGITALTAHRTSSRVAAEKGASSAATEYKRSLATLVILVVYSVFVGAITVIRIQNSSEEDASRVELVAQGLLMLATAVGPAWLAEYLMKTRAPAVVLQKRVRMTRRRLKDTERAHARARDAVNRIAREGARWDIEAARRRALNSTHHRLEGAKEQRA